MDQLSVYGCGVRLLCKYVVVGVLVGAITVAMAARSGRGFGIEGFNDGVIGRGGAEGTGLGGG